MNFRLISRECFIPSPAKGAWANATTYYTERAGLRLMCLHAIETRSDTLDMAYLRFSDDNGRTWSGPSEWPTRFDAPSGTGRRHPRGGFVDPLTGGYVTLWTEGVLPTDRPTEGMRRWTLHYSVSQDGGRTTKLSEQITHDGPGYDAVHHLPGVTVGKNAVMIGDFGCRPLTRSDGVLLVPVQSSPTGPDGEYWNPRNALTYTDAMILMGRWRPDGRLAWTCSQRVKGDPARTTRGLVEPTIAELAGGRMLMVMRGSNHRALELPGWRWHALSSDGGQTWSEAAPWTFTDQTPFHSPSSCSQLIPWRDGRLFWIGNICERNPAANAPRYPIVIAEVDRETGLLIRDSVRVIDDRQPGESEKLTLSNFYAREDRETGHLLLHLSRIFAHDFDPAGMDWTADALLYRMSV